MTLLEIKRQLRAGAYTMPGCYPLVFITRDGGALCFACVRKEWRNIVDDHLRNMSCGWRVEGCQVNWEDPHLFCDHCGKRVESAYMEHINHDHEAIVNTGTPEVSRASHCS